MPTDIEIAQSCTPKPITQIAAKAGIPEEAISPYGRIVAKVDPQALSKDKQGRLVLVTAITPTPAGEGKTTVSVALADGMTKLGKNAMLALREPSLGPVFGMKGGATGGGWAQVLPMEAINLHFTGDLHAITAANNLLAAMVDNHIQQGNLLGIDPRKVTWRRCLDVNDRQLRQIVSGLGGKGNGMPREDGFDITAASEVMAVFCLASSLQDLKARLARLQVARTYDNRPVTAGDLHAEGAMAALLRDALQPNLVQTIDGTPCLIHGGPFANIAHGCNSVIATRTALRLADYVVTEAGFGADLGAEKFLDIKCRQAGLWPNAVVLVATIRALKHHGGCPKDGLGQENLEALCKGLPNLVQHIENLRNVYQLPVIVAINHFVSDTEAEIAMVREACANAGAPCAFCDGWAKGGAGATELAELVCKTVDAQTGKNPSFCYEDSASLKDKITAVATKIYHADSVNFAAGVLKQLADFEAEGWGSAPVCIAKTQYSFSDDPKKLGAPSGYTLTIRQVRLSAGAGFIVAFAGDIIAMPGLPKTPAALNIDVADDGRIVGLF
ncbi:MAG: formate--tetrahydrofolate ligase [Clostridia bacterium]|nr:formate--tetrahydrofolate ligase [Clostridia bacterium]